MALNVFVVSPGRTGTTALSRALAGLHGYTAGHETRVKELGDARVSYPENHIECDNRLVWFLPRLTARYGATAILVVVRRDPEVIARSYDQRWTKINIMKAYSQGILMRELSENSLDVCRDYVANSYEHINFFRREWHRTIDIDLEQPEEGITRLLAMLDRLSCAPAVLQALSDSRLNQNFAGLKRRGADLRFNWRVLLWDLLR